MNWALVAIVALGLALRFWGIGYGLPYTYGPDEPTYVSITLKILKTGDLNPHWWYYPSLMFYMNAIALAFLFLAGRLLGYWQSTADLPFPQIITMGVGKLDMPAEFWVTRGLTALLSVLAIVVVYWAGRRLHANKWVGIIAALLCAVSPTIVDHSQRVGPDIFALFFMLIAFLFSVLIIDSPRMRYYIGAGIAVGLAIASKYNSGLIILPLLVAHLINFGFSGYRRREVWVALFSIAIAFVLASPYAILDFVGFWEGVRFQVFSYTAEGHAGQEGNALAWYISYLWNTEGWVSFVAVIAAVYGLFNRSKNNLVLLSFPLVYFGLVSGLLIRNARTIMLVIPFLDILAAMLVLDLVERLQRTRFPVALGTVIGIVIVALMTIPPLQTTVAANERSAQIDSRETSRLWLESYLPDGARVAQEAYTPFIDTRRFIVHGLAGLIDQSPEWYIQNGFDYLVFGQGMYGRFFDEPRQYAKEIAKYNEFFQRFPLFKQFNDNGYEVRIYKTDVVLPSHRTAARFGNYGELIELVGYDIPSEKLQPGQPFKINLWWRPVGETREPLELELRLLDRDNHEISNVRGDLFQGLGWRDGMFQTAWNIPVPSDAAPGAYHIETNVIQSRFSYRTPAKTWAGETIDPVSVGQFKLIPAPPAPSEIQSARPANLRWGDQMVLLAYRSTAEIKANDALTISLYWQAVSKPANDYTVFLHLLDRNGNIRAQLDAQPGNGSYPTSLWDAGEIIRNDYTLALPTDLAADDYRLAIGLYAYPNLARLSVFDAKGNSIGDQWTMPESVRVTR